MANADEYLGLLSAYHRPRPRFGATVAAVCGAAAAVRDLYAGMPDTFDLDLAVGAQLDTVGRWIGLGRRVATPISGVYFALDIEGLGMDQGVWQGPFDPDNGLTVLDDDTYRLLLRAKIGANHWDGTLETSAAILNQIFQGGTHVLIEDNGDMSVDIGVAGAPPSALFLALLTGATSRSSPKACVSSTTCFPRARGRCSVLTCRTNTSRGSTTDSGDRCSPVEFAGSIRKTLRGYQSNPSLRHRRRANVLAPADYQALASRNAGFSAGTAKSKELNTVWRQASFVAAMLGQYIADKSGQDVLDNGDLAALQAKFVAALAASPAFTGTPTAPTPAAATRAASLPPPPSWPATSRACARSARCRRRTSARSSWRNAPRSGPGYPPRTTPATARRSAAVRWTVTPSPAGQRSRRGRRRAEQDRLCAPVGLCARE